MPHTDYSGCMAESPKIVELRGIADPLLRAAGCQAFILYAREAVRAAERLRDEAIREARTKTRPTVDVIAEAVGAKRNVVVNALRGVSS